MAETIVPFGVTKENAYGPPSPYCPLAISYPCIREVPGHRENNRADKQAGDPIRKNAADDADKVTSVGVVNPCARTKGFKKLSMKMTVTMQAVKARAGPVVIVVQLHTRSGATMIKGPI